MKNCFWSLIDLPNSYLMVSSVVGFYSLRVFEVLTPRKDDTTMTTVKMGWKDRVKWGQGCWDCSEGADVFGTPCVSSISSFPPSPAFLSTELLLLPNVFLRAPQWL